MALREVRGAIHVHSTYSDGSGSVEEIIAAARSARLDYVILTDHDTVGAAADGYAGRHGDVLFVVGSEVSPSRRGHCLTLGGVDTTGFRWMPDEYYLHKLRRDGAEVYIAHPEGRVKPAFGINLRQWHVWESEHFDGIEIWSYMHDWVENVTGLTMPYYYLHPDSAIDGPNERVLGLWDRLNLHRRVAGVGALDAHAVRMLFGAFVAFPYEKLFSTILTHVIVDEWGADAESDTLRLRAALKSARAFVAYDALSPSEGFRFRASNGMILGDRAPYEAGLTLEVSVPARADLCLVRNGRMVDAREGTSAKFGVKDPGVYRAEAWIAGRPWIFSNPIALI